MAISTVLSRTTKGLVNVTLMSLILSLSSVAFGQAAQAPVECIDNPSQVARSPRMSAALDKIGGMNNLAGLWNYSFLFIKVRGIFSVRPDGIFAKVNSPTVNHDFFKVRLCTDGNPNSGVQAHFTDPETGGPGVVVLRQSTKSQDNLQILARQANWSPVEFTKAATQQSQQGGAGQPGTTDRYVR